MSFVRSERPASETAAIFAANRANGRIRLTVRADGTHTRKSMISEEGSLRVRFPGALSRELEGVLVNTAGGIAGGDRLSVDIGLEDGAALVMTSAAAEKVYRSLGPDADITVKLEVGAGARLAWLPQETILFDGGRLNRTIDVALGRGGSLLLAEAIVFGRTAMEEAVEEGRVYDSWRVRRDGRLVFAEALRLEGRISHKLGEPAIAGGGVAVATVLLAPGNDDHVEAVRSLQGLRGEVGVSAWNGIAVVRLVARDGAALRHDVILVLTALRGSALPRLWLN
jgi:urease accessory protein